jgi:pilus assembly protein CpaD
MTTTKTPRAAARTATRSTLGALTAASLAALAIAGCRPDSYTGAVAGWSLADPTQRHPIMVSQQPAKLAVRVARGSTGLNPHQRAQVIDFIDRYKAVDAGNSKMVIHAPAGSANEVAAMQAVAEIRHLMRDSGFDESAIMVEAYHDEREPQPPVRISYLRYIAEGPECGQWPTNLARDPGNVPYPNLGCAMQRNLAAQIANPADLLGPRSQTPRSGERGFAVWEKYVKGESTVSEKKSDERSQVKGAN